VRDVSIRVIANHGIKLGKPDLKGMDADTFRLTGLLKSGLADSSKYSVSETEYYTRHQGWANGDFFVKLTMK